MLVSSKGKDTILASVDSFPSKPTLFPPRTDSVVSCFDRTIGCCREAIRLCQMKYKQSPGWQPQPRDAVYTCTKHLQVLQPSKKLGWKFIGPYSAKHCINEVAAELNLPKSL